MEDDGSKYAVPGLAVKSWLVNSDYPIAIHALIAHKLCSGLTGNDSVEGGSRHSRQRNVVRFLARFLGSSGSEVD